MLKPLVIASERVIAVTQYCLCKNDEKKLYKKIKKLGKRTCLHICMYIV